MILPTARYRFRYLRLWWVRFSCVLGIVFDTCVCGGCASPVCWVSFSIPAFVVGALLLCAGYRFRYL